MGYLDPAYPWDQTPDPVTPATPANGINLRTEFDEIMKTSGHWGVLRRRVDLRHSTDYNPHAHEGEDLSSTSSGHKYVDEFVVIRKSTFFSTSEDPKPEGRASSPLIVFWVRSTVKPSRGDFLLEIAQDEASLDRGARIQPVRPFTVTRKYDIQDVDDMREAGGRVEFFRLIVEEADLGDEG